jgi:predicted phosphoribosyltransferase
MGAQARIVELPDLRDRTRVFKDRTHAGEVVASMLEDLRGSNALLLAIPAGGVPVAVEMARRLALELDVAVVSKITLPWNTESGYGAVAFDGTVKLNDAMLPRLGLTEDDIREGVKRTSDKVQRRVEKLRGGRPFPDLTGRTCVLIDDGLASGFTMLTAASAVKKAGASRVLVAVPTAHDSSAGRLAVEVETVYCANMRSGFSFAVADAYENWYDLGEEEVAGLLE